MTKAGTKRRSGARGNSAPPKASARTAGKPARPKGHAVDTTRSRSSGSEQSITRILDATMEAASRQGLRNLSMSDVIRYAGVARGTLYRYFPSKEALLEALGQRTRQQTEAGIKAAAAAAGNGEQALVAVIQFLTRFADESKAAAMLEVEPEFFMDFLRRHLPQYARVMAGAIAPFFEELEQGLGSKVDRILCCELILRLQVSYVFLPDPNPREQLLETILGTLSRLSRPA